MSQPRLNRPDSPRWDGIFNTPSFALGVLLFGESLDELRFLPAQPSTIFKPSPLLQEVWQQLNAWRLQANFAFDLPLRPFAAKGTPFRQAVWQEIATIPYGTTRSYGEIAKQLNSSPRAVGQACGDNPFPIIIPCHRVLAAQQQLGGFNHQARGDLLAVKTWLLQREGICI